MKFASTIAACSVVMVSACHHSTAMTAKEVRALVDANLHAGDPEAKILEFFVRQHWPYDYDRFQQRFQSRCAQCDVESLLVKKGVDVWIYVDARKSFVRADVKEVHTGS